MNFGQLSYRRIYGYSVISLCQQKKANKVSFDFQKAFVVEIV